MERCRWRRGVRRASFMAMAVVAVAGAGPGCNSGSGHLPFFPGADTGPLDSGSPEDTGTNASDPANCFEPKRVVPPTTVCSPGDTHLFVVNILDFARTSAETGQTPGFNLDLCNTVAGGNTGCGYMDRRFDIDQNGVVAEEEHGVDNQLAELASILAALWMLQDSVDAGDPLLMVRVANVQSLVNDPCVDVALLLASVPAGSVLEHDAEGRLAPGQEFDIDPSSYDGTGNPKMAAKGLIEQGRLYAGPMTVELPLPLEDGLTIWRLRNAQLAFNMATDHLDVGTVGGGINVDDFIASVDGLLSDDFPPQTFREFLEPLMDLNPDANNTNCDSVSIAFSFEAVTAEEHQE
jgi:hypothetical protein